ALADPEDVLDPDQIPKPDAFDRARLVRDLNLKSALSPAALDEAEGLDRRHEGYGRRACLNLPNRRDRGAIEIPARQIPQQVVRVVHARTGQHLASARSDSL